MKQLGAYEKWIIKKIIEIDSIPGSLNVLGNILDEELFPFLYLHLRSSNSVPVMIDQNYITTLSNLGPGSLQQFIKQLQTKIVLLVKLLEYLEKESYIIFSGSIQLSTLGSQIPGKTYASYNVPDPTIIPLIYHYSSVIIIPTDSLRKYVANGFRTDSELAADEERNTNKKMLFWTSIGVWIAGVGTISSLIFQILEPDELKLKNPISVTLDPNCFNKDTISINIVDNGNSKSKIQVPVNNRVEIKPKVITKPIFVRDTCLCSK